MLQYLQIRNLALLDEVFLDFEPGFTAVTGETGAGKSILLGAFALLSGARAEKTLIREGASSCEVEAGLFFPDPTEINALLDDLDLPLCEEGALLLKRVIPRDKMPRISVNGSLTTLTNLQQIGEVWIDFHGPGEPQKLFRTANQLRFLDLYGNHGPILEDYGVHFAEWGRLNQEKEALLTEESLDEDERQFLENQLAKIEQCNPTPERIADLERDYGRMSRAQELIQLARDIEDGLSGDEGILARLSQLQRAARELVAADEESAPLAGRLESIAVETADLAAEFSDLASRFDFEPEEAENLEDRMNLWLELQRKYGPAPESVAAKADAIRARLERQGDIAGTIGRIDAAIQKEAGLLTSLSRKLEKARKQAGTDLAEKTSGLLSSLGFRKALFEVAILPENEWTAHGGTRCEFLFAPNPGQSMLPLNKIASSGEIARVMLALKTLLAEADNTPLLVFDEVDANVGGEIGRIVGQRLHELSAGRQIFCVTHLPQVASLAKAHLVVEKVQTGEKTLVQINSIHSDAAARVSEIARMLGDREAKSARAHADELLKVP